MQAQCARLFAIRNFLPCRHFGPDNAIATTRFASLTYQPTSGEHPVSHMLAGMFECHDRARFETLAVSFGAPIRRRCGGGSKRLSTASSISATAATLRLRICLREGEIDIAIDLMGPTQGARPAILAYRPAPIQVMYLGYAGSSGAPYFDYILADRIVIPEVGARFFREKVVYLPETFHGHGSQSAPSR